jgi:hypothetical protein
MPEGTTGTITPPPDGGTPPGSGGTPPAGKVTFTLEQQEEVNRIVQERLGRERTRLEAETKNQYGDYDDLKAKAAELKKIKDAELSDTQRLQQELDALKAEKAGWESEKAARELEIGEELLQAEIKAQAPGFGIPWDVAYHLGDFEADGEFQSPIHREFFSDRSLSHPL